MDSYIQRGRSICHLRINRDTSRKQHLDNVNLTFPRCHVQQNFTISTRSDQKLYDIDMSRPSSRVQQGLTIFSLRIDRNTDRKQGLDNANLSFIRCRVQQGFAVGTCSDQKLGDTGMSRPSGRVQRHPATVRRQVSPSALGK